MLIAKDEENSASDVSLDDLSVVFYTSRHVPTTFAFFSLAINRVFAHRHRTPDVAEPRNKTRKKQ